MPIKQLYELASYFILYASMDIMIDWIFFANLVCSVINGNGNVMRLMKIMVM